MPPDDQSMHLSPTDTRNRPASQRPRACDMLAHGVGGHQQRCASLCEPRRQTAARTPLGRRQACRSTAASATSAARALLQVEAALLRNFERCDEVCVQSRTGRVTSSPKAAWSHVLGSCSMR
eukprot:6186867-Pleurochrysis_carterae.AAC.7